jgi:hypothetical protein
MFDLQSKLDESTRLVERRLEESTRLVERRLEESDRLNQERFDELYKRIISLNNKNVDEN